MEENSMDSECKTERKGNCHIKSKKRICHKKGANKRYDPFNSDSSDEEEYMKDRAFCKNCDKKVNTRTKLKRDKKERRRTGSSTSESDGESSYDHARYTRKEIEKKHKNRQSVQNDYNCEKGSSKKDRYRADTLSDASEIYSSKGSSASKTESSQSEDECNRGRKRRTKKDKNRRYNDERKKGSRRAKRYLKRHRSGESVSKSSESESEWSESERKKSSASKQQVKMCYKRSHVSHRNFSGC
jgi:hypothetical protein